MSGFPKGSRGLRSSASLSMAVITQLCFTSSRLETDSRKAPKDQKGESGDRGRAEWPGKQEPEMGTDQAVIQQRFVFCPDPHFLSDSFRYPGNLREDVSFGMLMDS